MLKKELKYFSLIGVIIMLTCLTNACSNINDEQIQVKTSNKPTVTSISEVKPVKTPTITDASNNAVNDKNLKRFVLDVITAMAKSDSKAFKKYIDKDGIYSITYFIDGRDQNVVLHLDSSEIRDDLVLANDKKMGNTLITMFGENLTDQNEEIQYHETKESMGIDWHKNNEDAIQNKISHIIKTCENLILINNRYVLQVFRMKDNIFAFTLSNESPEPNKEFTGDWVIFEKEVRDYKIRAIIKMQ